MDNVKDIVKIKIRMAMSTSIITNITFKPPSNKLPPPLHLQYKVKNYFIISSKFGILGDLMCPLYKLSPFSNIHETFEINACNKWPVYCM